MSHIYCPECGFQNPEAANYCAKCGALLHERESESVEQTQSFTAEVLEPTHPACAHLGGGWSWHDEVYQFRDLRSDARVLLRVPEEQLDLTQAGLSGRGHEFPLAWCFEEQAGRVFSTSLGHFPTAWENPAYLRHLHGGLEWTLTDA